MTRTTSILILLLAAILEAGGDAFVRKGMHGAEPARRFALFISGACVLFAYAWLVNAPPWRFGSLLGLYVVFFFVIAQLMSWVVFGEPPSIAVMVGGGLIISGGVIIAIAQ
jgi:drug/metabolite transporter (DMT)-like permease